MQIIHSLPVQKAATGAEASSLAVTDLTAPIPATTARNARRLLHKETKTPFVVLRARAATIINSHRRTRVLLSAVRRQVTHCAGRVSASMYWYPALHF